MSKKLGHLAAQLAPATPATPTPDDEAPPAPPAKVATPVDRLAPNKAPTWEEMHQRATFHLPREMVAAVRATAKAEGVSASAWVARALSEALD